MDKVFTSLLAGLLFCVVSMSAQQPTFTISPTSNDVQLDDIFEVDITVSDFMNILSMQYGITWDSNILKFQQVKNVNSTIPGFTQAAVFSTPNPGGSNNVPANRMGVSWFHPSFLTLNLTDGAVLFTLEFQAIGLGTSDIQFSGPPTPGIEVLNGNFTNVGLNPENATATVGASGCTAPTNLSVNNPSSNTATISWSAVPGAVEYFIQYIVQGAPLNTVSTGTTTMTQVTLPGLLPSTTYQWRVRAICSDENSPYSDIASFTTSACSDMDGDGICDSQDDCPDLDDALIGSPCDDGDDCTENDVYGTDCNCAGQLIDTNANDICDLLENSCEAPVNLQAIDLTDDSATLAWDAVLGATEYQVQYLENGAPTSAVVSLTVTSNSVDITDLIFGSGYQWRVKAICPDGDTPWSETGEFLIGIAPCPKPANLLAQSQSATSATFSWDAVAEATAYRFQYRPIGGDGVSIDVPVSSSYTVNNLPVGATVQWRVRSLCDGENSGFEVGPSVTLSAPMPLVGGSNDSGFTLFPNPNDGQFTVSLPYREQGSTVVVRNAVGQTVYTAQTTETQLLIDLRGAYSASGLLFVTVQGEGRAPVTKRVLVSR